MYIFILISSTSSSSSSTPLFSSLSSLTSLRVSRKVSVKRIDRSSLASKKLLNILRGKLSSSNTRSITTLDSLVVSYNLSDQHALSVHPERIKNTRQLSGCYSEGIPNNLFVDLSLELENYAVGGKTTCPEVHGSFTSTHTSLPPNKKRSSVVPSFQALDDSDIDPPRFPWCKQECCKQPACTTGTSFL
jgi:hypothetical protein